MIFEYNLFFVSELLAYKEPAVGSHSMYRSKMFRHSDAKDLLSAVAPAPEGFLITYKRKKSVPRRDGPLSFFETTLFPVRNRYKHVYRYLAHYYFFSLKY